jgi:hypothetical protein
MRKMKAHELDVALNPHLNSEKKHMHTQLSLPPNYYSTDAKELSRSYGQDIPSS